MIKIRPNCFETNSSSTHAFVIDTSPEATRYTKDHFEAFTELIFPFSREEVSNWDDPHLLTDLKDKVRYFWTIYLYHNFSDADDKATNFMKKLQSILPQAIFCLQFPEPNGSYLLYDYLPYLEDGDYVLNHSEGDNLVTWTITQIESLLADGVIIFGDRDLTDYFGDSIIDNVIEQSKYKILNKISG